MFAGKSEELLRRVRRAVIARERVLIVKPDIDTRSREALSSHDGRVLLGRVIAYNDPDSLVPLVQAENAQVVGIDEAQFLEERFRDSVLSLVYSGVRVIVAGLDMDFAGKPFRLLADLLAVADEVTKLSAICVRCGRLAGLSQRIIDGRPARLDEARILVGGEERYEARCRECHHISQ